MPISLASLYQPLAAGISWAVQVPQTREALAELRALPGLREKSAGTFYVKGSAFLHFHEEVEYFGRKVIPLVRELEARLARTKGAEACCVFGAGYLVNAGVAPVFAGMIWRLFLSDDFGIVKLALQGAAGIFGLFAGAVAGVVERIGDEVAQGIVDPGQAVRSASWAGARPDHTVFTAATNCASCHNGNNAPGKPSGHVVMPTVFSPESRRR